MRTSLTQHNVKLTAADWLQKGFRAAIFAGLIVFVLALFGFMGAGDGLPAAVGAVAWISFMVFAPHKQPDTYPELVPQVEPNHSGHEQPASLPADLYPQQVSEQPTAAMRQGTDYSNANPKREWVMEVPSAGRK